METNPGSNSQEKSKPALHNLLSALVAFQKGQDAILQEMKPLQVSLEAIKPVVKNHSDNFNAIEQIVLLFQQVYKDVAQFCSSPSNAVTNIAVVSSQLDDLESRYHRNNHVFYGFEDTQSEPWNTSGKRFLMLVLSY